MTRRDLWVALAAAVMASGISTTVLAQRWEAPESAAPPPKWEIVCEGVPHRRSFSDSLSELTDLGQEAGAKGYQLVQVLLDPSVGPYGVCFQRPR
jgi:hypothetical protein